MPLVQVPGTKHRNEDFDLNAEAIECLWRMEDHHFWHKERNAWIITALRKYGALPPQAILEVGCGSGAVVRAMTHAGYRVTGVDTAEALTRKAYERCPTATIVTGDVATLPEGCRGPFDVIGVFDVLEHLDHPEELLKTATRWAVPGALVVVTVPAWRSMYTVVDELSGHKRRYDPGEIKSLFESIGLSDVVEHGIFASTLALQRLQRRNLPKAAALTSAEYLASLVRRTHRIPLRPINLALGLLTKAERAIGLESAIARKGASILAVARCRQTAIEQ